MKGDGHHVVLRGSDGRRWWIENGGGRAVELKEGKPPPKPKRKGFAGKPRKTK